MADYTEDSLRTWTVYAHINKTNGKIYIGLTKQKPEDRWRDGKGYRNNVYFWKAIQKYGWDGFDHEIIASGLTKDEASKFEEVLIDLLDLLDHSKGYNLYRGGGCGKNADDLTGKRFGKLVVLKRDFSKPYKIVHWIVRCDCGTVKSVAADDLRRKGHSTISCGCYLKERKLPSYQHGESHTRLYNKWVRCKEYYRDHNTPLPYEFSTYLLFKEWMLSHGYEDGDLLFRPQNDDLSVSGWVIRKNGGNNNG